MQQQQLCTYSSHYNWQCVDFCNSLQMKTLVLININVTFVCPQVIFIPEFLYHYAECSLFLDYKYVHTISSKWNWPKNTHIKSSLQKSMRSYRHFSMLDMYILILYCKDIYCCKYIHTSFRSLSLHFLMATILFIGFHRPLNTEPNAPAPTTSKNSTSQ